MLRPALISSLAILAVSACGSSHGARTASSAAPATSTQSDAPLQGSAGFADTGPQGTIMTVVLKAGTDPQVVAHRIAGPNAKVVLAVQAQRRNASAGAANRTFVVTVEPGQELDTLQRALADPDVQRAYLAKNLGG